MTLRVRKGYRNHRRTTWALGVALVALIAAIAIPITLAGTAATKYYTLTASPNPACASATDGVANTTLTLKNTAGSQTLGSAQIYLPANSVSSVSPSTWTKASNQTSPFFTGRMDIVSRNNIGLSAGRSTTITVNFKAGTFTGPISATVKQSNNFNDTSGTANLFVLDPAQGSFQTLNVVTCGTIGGRVYEDRNFDSTYTAGTGAFDTSDVPKGWTVSLYSKDASASSYPSSPDSQTTADPSTGLYSFTQKPSGRDYELCVTATGGDANSEWGLRSPTGNTDCAPLGTSTFDSGANLVEPLNGDATSEDFIVEPVTHFDSNGETSIDGYTVIAGSNSAAAKLGENYIQDLWVDGSGRTNFRFAPLLPCTQNCSDKVYLLEKLDATIPVASLGGEQVVLKYTDAPTYLDSDLKTMPYCLKDPRAGQQAGDLATDGVLPSAADTSCVVSGSQLVADGEVQVEYYVYTTVDGGRQIGVS